ncbi:hypothetical protein ACFQ7G_22315 [Streptomyces massasporeus]
MTEPPYVTAVRESYDTVAAEYVRRVKEPAELDPVSRAMLAAFAELAAPLGPVADLGAPGVPVCGVDPPDRIAELLHRAGLVVTTRVVREPEGGAKRQAGTFLAYKQE